MQNKNKILVTGGGGFIGSHFINEILSINPDKEILNLDCISYATSSKTLDLFNDYKNYQFKNIDINNFEDVLLIFKNFEPDIVVHFAAESHVDNSVTGPRIFLETNIMGTFNLLQASLEVKKILPSFVFHHVSTDEVYGDLDFHDAKFTELSNYKPSSPYSASKASSDLMVQSWARTFNLDYVITNCSNNFGARQHTEKLIPTVIRKIINNQKVPIYGDGLNIRDWIYAKDHAQAIISIHEHNVINEKINIGGDHEISNLSLVKDILTMMGSDEDLIEFVEDRPGHDLRYAIDNSKIYSLTDWKPTQDFDQNIKETIEWYKNNPNWWES
jgi:dTDP-glucose 4,6-dehydratase